MRAALAAAIADKDARARRHALSQAVQGDWNRIPALATLVRHLDAIDACAPEAADMVLAAASGLLADTEWLATGMTHLIAAAGTDPLFEPPFRVLSGKAHIGLDLVTHPLLSIEFAVLRPAPAPRSVVFDGRRSLLRILRAGEAQIDLWTAAATDDGFRSAAAGECRHAGRMTLADNALIAIDGRCEAWTLAHANTDLVLLKARARCDRAVVATEHDVATGALLGSAATDGAAACLQMLASLLVAMGRRDAAPAVAAAAADGPFYLRWHMARAAAALDRQAALPLLRAMAAGDPHPDLRDAAALTIHRIAA